VELINALREEIGQLDGAARTAAAAITDRRPGWVRWISVLARMVF
jgi:hypothetical protein